jgi:hypothetical protein
VISHPEDDPSQPHPRTTISPDEDEALAQPPDSEQVASLVDNPAPKNADAGTQAKSAPLIQPSAPEPATSHPRQERKPQRKFNRGGAPSSGSVVPEANPPVPEQTDAERFDAEIASLRLALAEKLRAQNSLLQKMLERYDRA